MPNILLRNFTCTISINCGFNLKIIFNFTDGEPETQKDYILLVVVVVVFSYKITQQVEGQGKVKAWSLGLKKKIMLSLSLKASYFIIDSLNKYGSHTECQE